jgi:hypothetical protein
MHFPIKQFCLNVDILSKVFCVAFSCKEFPSQVDKEAKQIVKDEINNKFFAVLYFICF